MQLGIYLNSQHSESDDPARRFAETLEQVRLIRSLDFDSISITPPRASTTFRNRHCCIASPPRPRGYGSVPM